MILIQKLGDHGDAVAILQRRLNRAGHSVDITHVYDAATELAVKALQRAAGLVVDGIAGPKTFIALSGASLPYHLADADLVAAAARLQVPVACIRAVNEVESRGQGMLGEGRPAILFERHVFYKRLAERGYDVEAMAVAKPNLVCDIRGGYSGGAAEYVRLEAARQIDVDAANESTSWGAFQIMGYHWEALGYDSIAAFVDSMKTGEAAHLEAFTRFIAHDPALLTALKGKKWTAFAKGYNGPDYARNLYDVKLAEAYSRYIEAEKVAA